MKSTAHAESVKHTNLRCRPEETKQAKENIHCMKSPFYANLQIYVNIR